MNEQHDEVSLRRQIAEKLGCVIEDDYCVFAGIKPTTAEAHRQRGKAPPYIVIGTSIVYPVEALAAHLRAKIRVRAAVPAKAFL